MADPVKLIRITTVPISLNILLKGQLKFMGECGFQVLTISADGEEVSEFKIREGVDHIMVPFTRKITPLQDLFCLYKLIKIIKKERPTIIHSHTPKAGLLGMLAAKICDVPNRLHTVAGLPLMESRGIKRKVLKYTEIITYKCATQVYPNSYNLKEFIERKIYSYKGKLKVIGKGSTNGVSIDDFSKTDSLKAQGMKWLKVHSTKKNPFIFTFIGRIVKDKGINELVRAFKNIKNESTLLILIGPYEDLDPIQPYIKDEIMNNPAIITTGFQSDIRPFLSITDLFVFPSYREGFPNVLLQAGAMGVPSIASNINGCNEIIEHRKSGWLVESKNQQQLSQAMEYLMLNDEIRKSIAQEAFITVRKNYDQKYVWNKILEEYKQLT